MHSVFSFTPIHHTQQAYSIKLSLHFQLMIGEDCRLEIKDLTVWRSKSYVSVMWWGVIGLKLIIFPAGCFHDHYLSQTPDITSLVGNKCRWPVRGHTLTHFSRTLFWISGSQKLKIEPAYSKIFLSSDREIWHRPTKPGKPKDIRNVKSLIITWGRLGKQNFSND